MVARIVTAIFLVTLLLTAVSGCATSPYGYDRVATTSFGMGALGTALGYAATGDPRWAAVGGLSGLAGGYLLGESLERSRAYGEEPPPPPYRHPGSSYDRPGSSYGYNDRERCRTVTTIIKEDGVVVDEYEREVCDDEPYPDDPDY